MLTKILCLLKVHGWTYLESTATCNVYACRFCNAKKTIKLESLDIKGLK